MTLSPEPGDREKTFKVVPTVAANCHSSLVYSDVGKSEACCQSESCVFGKCS